MTDKTYYLLREHSLEIIIIGNKVGRPYSVTFIN